MFICKHLISGKSFSEDSSLKVKYLQYNGAPPIQSLTNPPEGALLSNLWVLIHMFDNSASNRPVNCHFFSVLLSKA